MLLVFLVGTLSLEHISFLWQTTAAGPLFHSLLKALCGKGLISVWRETSSNIHLRLHKGYELHLPWDCYASESGPWKYWHLLSLCYHTVCHFPSLSLWNITKSHFMLVFLHSPLVLWTPRERRSFQTGLSPGRMIRSRNSIMAPTSPPPASPWCGYYV